MRRFLFLFVITTPIFGQFNLEGIEMGPLNSLMEDAGKTNSDGMVIYRGEERVGSWTFGKEDKIMDARSITPAIAALAVGLLLEEGKLDGLDVKLSTFFPEWKSGDKATITLEHLLAHTTGLTTNTEKDTDPNAAEDLVAYALETPVMAEPGKYFLNNPRVINLLGPVVEKAAGKPLDAYLAEKVFEPMGLESISWSRDAKGNLMIMTGLQILPDELAKIGVLHLQKGRWQDKQLVPASWIEKSWAPAETEVPNTGLCWYLIYGETIYVIDDELLDRYRAADVDPDFIEGMYRLRGRYNGRTAVYAMFIGSFGKNWQGSMQKYLGGRNLPITKREYANLMGYNTSGREGQWLVIFPEKNLVGVRMIAPDSIQDDQTDLFSRFGDLLRRIVKDTDSSEKAP